MSVQALMEKLTTQLTSGFGSTVNLNMGDDGMVHIDGNQTPPAISLDHADADGTINMSLKTSWRSPMAPWTPWARSWMARSPLTVTWGLSWPCKALSPTNRAMI